MSKINQVLVFVAIATTLLVVGGFATTKAGAISNTYFDNADASGRADIHLAVGQTDYVQRTSAKLKVYFAQNSGRIEVHGYNYCPSRGDEGPASNKRTKFTVNVFTGKVRKTGESEFSNGTKSHTSGYVTNGSRCNDVLTFRMTDLRKDTAGTGRYMAMIDVDNVDTGYMNYFKIKTTNISGNPAGKVSHAKGNRGYDVTVDQIGNTPSHTNYKIKFGSDCSVTGPVRMAIRLYDLDGPGGSGAQVGNISMKLRAKHQSEGNGAWRYIKIANQRGRNNTNDPHPNVNNDRGSTSISPLSLDNADQLVWFTAKQNYQYEFELNNIYYNNTIQYGVPFDGFFYETGCQKWDTTPNSYVKRCDRERWGRAGRTITVSRPTDVCFKHSLKNDGPGIANTKARVQKNWNASKRVGDPNTYSNIDGWNRFNSLDEDAVGNSPNYSLNFPTSVTTAPDGTKYCQRYFVDPKKMTIRDGTTGTGESTPACAIIGNNPDPDPDPVPPQYELNASISISPRTYAYKPNVSVTGSVEYTGTPAGAHTWEMYAVRYSDEPNITLGVESGDIGACGHLPANNRVGDCERIYAGVFPASYRHETVYRNGGPDPVGTHLCFFTRVQNPSEDSDDDADWRYSSTMECAISGVKPKIQVRGGDAKATGKIETSLSDIGTRRFGSWGEYGVLSNGSNSYMGSGAALGLPSATFNSAQSSWSDLTFRNNGGFGTFGGALSHTPISRSGSVAGTTTINSLSSILSTNKRQTIVVGGNLTISGDLIYPLPRSSGFNSIKEIPRIVIIADNIVITGNVRRIDPWIVATNNLSTCDEVPAATPLTNSRVLDSNKCDIPLRFNGPVIAGKAYLYRTHDTADGEAAETFNLRADNFLSSYSGGGSVNPIATTRVIKEAPPRF